MAAPPVPEGEPVALDEESLQQIYTWIDGIPLSRPKKNITRDFSDGVLIAEIIHHFIPKLVDLHNYTAANSTTTKLDNWNLLSRKCLGKLNCVLDENMVKGTVACKAGFIEHILQEVRQHIEAYLARKRAANLVEKQKYHDHLSPEANGNGEQYQYLPPNDGYNVQNYGGVGGYPGPIGGGGVGYATGGGGYSGDPPQTHPDGGFPYHYQYQSQPLASATDTTSTGSMPVDISAESSAKSNADHARKPITQASKMKNKPSAQKLPNSGNPSETNALRIALEEKEQALLASQETVQILRAKIRRLEHLLHLKDLRISEMKNQQQHQKSTMSQSSSNIPMSHQTSQDNVRPHIRDRYRLHELLPPP